VPLSTNARQKFNTLDPGWIRKAVSYRFSTTIGSAFTFRIDGDGFEILRNLGLRHGNIAIQRLLPNGRIANLQVVSNASGEPQFQRPLRITGLGAGPHFITVAQTAAGRVEIDGIRALALPQALPIGYYEETDTNLRYSANWNPVFSAGASGRYLIATNRANETVSFRVQGAGIVIYRTMYAVAGSLRIDYDGGAGNSGTTTVSSFSNTTLTQQPLRVVFTGSPTAERTVTITTVQTGARLAQQIDAVQVIPVSGPLTPAVGLYQDNDANLLYTNVVPSTVGWRVGTEPQNWGGSRRFTQTPNNSYSFQVANATSFLIYRSLRNNNAPVDLCLTDLTLATPESCTRVTGVNATPIFQQVLRPASPLLPTSTYQVRVIHRGTTLQVTDIDAIQVINTPLTLVPGFYQQTDLSLAFTGVWTDDPTNGLSRGQSRFSIEPWSSGTPNVGRMNFQFTGTGFIIFNTRVPTGAPMEVCYQIDGGASPQVCSSFLNTTASPTQFAAGHAIYGLKQGTYNVEVRHRGTTAQRLYIDGVTVLGNASFVFPTGRIEENNPGLVYAPGIGWATLNNPAYLGGSLFSTAQPGAVVQMRFIGRTLILSQAASTTGSTDLRLCIILQGPTVNPPNQCATFSQRTTLPRNAAPVIFYGFGTGTNDVVIENRGTGNFTLDRIQIQ
jgi:hypothetical protein